jgi:hypothetical protein
MRWVLRIYATVVLATMLWVTTWATLQCSIFAIPREVGSHPWFIATMFDAYWGFFTFYLWFVYKETAAWKRGVGLVLLVLLGNIFMSAYIFVQAWKLREGDSMENFLLRKGRKP